METQHIFEKMNREMNKSIDHVLSEFFTLHTGKANASMVENVNVDVYGSSMKLRDVAAITTPDARTIQIQPWDKSTAAPIEKALIDAKLGLLRLLRGNLSECQFPSLAENEGKSFARWLKDSQKTVELEYGHLEKTRWMHSKMPRKKVYLRMITSDKKKRFRRSRMIP